MALSMYDVSVPVYRQFLRSLLGVLDKGEKYCTDKGVDPASLFAARLIDDMQPLSFQIVQAVSHSAGALATMRGEQRPRATFDNTFAGAKQVIEQVLGELEAITPADLDALESKPVQLKFPGVELTFTAGGFLLGYALPQFFFHVTTAYDILRHKGVPIGKRDFLGRLPLVKA